MSRQKLSSQITEEIVNLINTEFFPGDKIPTEAELCERFNVSRTPLREAIKELCSMNVLEIKRGVGTFVKEHPGIANDPFGVKFMEKEKFNKDMWEIGLFLEPQLASLAAERATEEQIAELEKINEKYEKAVRKYFDTQNEEYLNKMFKYDGEFHIYISKLSDNEIFEHLYIFYTEMIHLNINSKDGVYIIDSNLKYHKEIIKDIKNKNPKEARRHMYIHNCVVRDSATEGYNKTE